MSRAGPPQAAKAPSGGREPHAVGERGGHPPRFEGSYLGDRHRLPIDAQLECKICWWVYDPQQGDAQWQIEPGTAFADLPAHWRCPQCDGAADQFMVVTP